MSVDQQHKTVIRVDRDWDTYLTLVDRPREYVPGCTFQWDSRTHAEATNPTVYVFTDNDAPNIRNSGVPELTTTLRSSFDPEPQWLDDAAWYDYDGRCYPTSTSEEQDGHHLRTSE